MAKKATLNKEESLELLNWLNLVLNKAPNTSIFSVLAPLTNPQVLGPVYDGGAVPLDQRSANNPPETNLASQVVDMSDKLVEKPVVKFSVPNKP